MKFNRIVLIVASCVLSAPLAYADSTAISPHRTGQQMVLCPIPVKPTHQNIVARDCVLEHAEYGDFGTDHPKKDVSANIPERKYAMETLYNGNAVVHHVAFTSSISKLKCTGATRMPGDPNYPFTVFSGIHEYTVIQDSRPSTPPIQRTRTDVSYYCCRPKLQWMPVTECNALR